MFFHSGWIEDWAVQYYFYRTDISRQEDGGMIGWREGEREKVGKSSWNSESQWNMDAVPWDAA